MPRMPRAPDTLTAALAHHRAALAAHRHALQALALALDRHRPPRHPRPRSRRGRAHRRGLP
jgi:hypothetical protein